MNSRHLAVRLVWGFALPLLPQCTFDPFDEFLVHAPHSVPGPQTVELALRPGVLFRVAVMSSGDTLIHAAGRYAQSFSKV
jgi:hypothetical protein